MIVDGFMQLLREADTVKAFLDEEGGTVSESVLPRGFKLPSIAVHTYDGTQDYDFSGPVDIREDKLQLDCYGRDAAEARQVAEVCRSLVENYTGTLPDGTIVQGTFVERAMAMPYLPNADQKGVANRYLLGFRVVSTRV